MLFNRFLSLCILISTTLGNALAQNFERPELPDSSMMVQVEGIATAGKSDLQPFWFTANRWGSLSVEGHHPTLLIGVYDRPRDLGHGWSLRYGATLTTNRDLDNNVRAQDVLLAVDKGASRFAFGTRAHDTPLNDAALSTGAFALGSNAMQPLTLSWQIPRWWRIGGVHSAFALRGHVAYGWLQDGNWQERRMAPVGGHFATEVKYYEKSGYLRIGTDNSRWEFIGGLEMANTFGGSIHHFNSAPLKMPERPSDYLFAFIGKGGGDPTDGEGYANASGNTIGAWRASLRYRAQRDWQARLYYDHYFEDDSQAFDEYGWLDGLLGLEIQFPNNRWVEKLVGEIIRMDYQSGPVYHDHTRDISDQVSGIDNYYNHNLYAGWQHYGMAMGNALFASPLYDGNKSLTFPANRFRAEHIGITGQPFSHLRYRLLYTHLKSWGTYALPFDDLQHQHSLLAEARWEGGSFTRGKLHGRCYSTAAIGADFGERLGNRLGFMLGFGIRLFGK